MYVIQQPHKCQKCGHIAPYGPHDEHPAPMLSSGQPCCPKCWDEFLTKNIGIMENLTFPKKEP